jgi:uncharacterized membrane protein
MTTSCSLLTSGLGAAMPLALDPYLRDWLDLLLRWLHVIAAIAWIGSSFYFVLLDQSLRPPARDAAEHEGVAGELWEVHGGGFYHVRKYRVAPSQLPDHLAWFKWEAYATWLSGFALLVVLYYAEASSTLVDPSVAGLEPWEGVAISIALLVVAWVVYDVLCRVLGAHDLWLAAAVAALTALAAWASWELFAPRAAWLQVGAMLGTIMAANVFFVIIPAHWELIRAKQAGRDPDAAPGIRGKQRSVHNNYLTLPVLLTMLAGHFAFLVGRSHAWLILVVLMAVGAAVRLFYNLRHAGRNLWAIPVGAAAVVVALAIALDPDDGGGEPATAAELARGESVFASAGCGGCHTLAAAGASGTVGPNLDGATPSRGRVEQIVATGQGVMPSFRSRLSEQEIAAVAAYVSSTAGQ